MNTWKKVVIWIASILVFLLAGVPLLAAGIRGGIIPLWKWGLGIETTTQTSVATIAPADDNEYHWGWDRGETKALKPGYGVGGDVAFEGVNYYDEGGVNEATVVINNSSRNVSVYAEWGAGEFTFAEKANSVTQVVRDEFATGNDPDADTVRVVVITDDGITQTWYNSKLEIIDHK